MTLLSEGVMFNIEKLCLLYFKLNAHCTSNDIHVTLIRRFMLTSL